MIDFLWRHAATAFIDPQNTGCSDSVARVFPPLLRNISAWRRTYALAAIQGRDSNPSSAS